MSRTVSVKGFSGLRQTVTIGPHQLLADEAKDVGSNDEGRPVRVPAGRIGNLHQHDASHVCADHAFRQVVERAVQSAAANRRSLPGASNADFEDRDPHCTSGPPTHSESRAVED